MDDGHISLYLLLSLACLIAYALVSLAYLAMETVSVGHVRELAEGGDLKAKRLEKLLDEPFRYRHPLRFLQCLTGNLGAILAWMPDYGAPIRKWEASGIYVLLMAAFSVIMTAKIARQHRTAIAMGSAGIVRGLSVLLLPLTWILTLLCNAVLTIFRQKTDVDDQVFSEDDVMSLLEEGQKSGEIMEEGRKMIGSIFRFDDELAYEIMTPRTDVFLIDIDDPKEAYIDELMGMRYTRVPVCEGDSDNIIGILNLKDYLGKVIQEGTKDFDIRSILRKAYFVPETKNIATLFMEMQKEKQHISILIDEYGGFSGICTMEDIIEEIVGDIDDEYDEEEETIDQISEDTYLADGSVSLDDFNEMAGTDLSSENSETIGGFILDLIGEIPKDGYVNRTVNFGRYEFTILSVKERRIERVKIHIGKESGEDGHEEREGRE